jgi:hypothetical protein
MSLVLSRLSPFVQRVELLGMDATLCGAERPEQCQWSSSPTCNTTRKTVIQLTIVSHLMHNKDCIFLFYVSLFGAT